MSLRHLTLPLLLCLTASLSAQDQKARAMALVKEAVAYRKQFGPAMLIKETNMGQGRFHFKPATDLYIFIFDLKGFALAHGFQGDLVNINRWDSKDPEGTYFVRDFIQTAQTKGSGWVDYKYVNPKTRKLDNKTSYVELIEGMVVGCGVYK